MRVYLGSDHAGFELKQSLLSALAAAGHETIDVGALAYHSDDDYPTYCLNAAARVVADPGSLGVVIGGSGNGEQIAANKVPGTRAALAWSTGTAQLARQHNDANVLAVGARMHTVDEAVEFVLLFVATPFSGAERHARRIAQLADYEATHTLPALPS
jgi:ribose 5-phosphate isomerase B